MPPERGDWRRKRGCRTSYGEGGCHRRILRVTSPLFPEENTSAGRFVGYGTTYDSVADPEDDGIDVKAFADFMRSTKAPSRGPITADVTAGEALFNQIGCVTCHTATLRTARPGTKVNGGAFTVPRR